MNNYELMFVIEAALDQERKDTIVENVKEIITSGGGEIAKADVWGTRKLAYPIKKKNEGFYVVLNFAANADLPKELDRRLKISDEIIRHMIINTDDK